MMKFSVTRKQFKELEGLAYWIADHAYIREYYGDDDPELDGVEKNIEYAFEQLDRLEVPYWIQNAICVTYADDWRTWKHTDVSTVLRKRMIAC